MPPEPEEVTGAAGEGGVQVEARDGASGALADPRVVHGHHHGRTGGVLHDARGGDPDDPVVPPRAGEHEGVAVALFRGVQLTQGGLEHLPVQPLARLVELLQLAGHGVRLVVGVRQQERQPLLGIPHTAGGVEARGQREAHPPGRERLPLHPRRADQRTDPRLGRDGVLHDAQPHLREHAVLTAQRRHVGDGAQCHQVEVLVRQVGIRSHRLAQRDRQLVGDPHRGQVLVHRRAIGAARVAHRQGGGQRPPGEMVIGDDHVDPRGDQVGDRARGAGTAVAGDHQGGPMPTRRRTAGRTEVVAVGAGRHPGHHRTSPKGPQHPGEQRGGCHAVHVVVPMDEDHLAAANGGHQALHGTVGVGHGARGFHMAALRAQEAHRGIARAMPARGQQLARHRRERDPLGRQRVRQRGKLRRIGGRRGHPSGGGATRDGGVGAGGA